jgi:hypothetical protein
MTFEIAIILIGQDLKRCLGQTTVSVVVLILVVLEPA